MPLKLLIAGLLVGLGILVGSASAGQRNASPPYRFMDLTVTRIVEHGKAENGFETYYRLNRKLPFAPKGKYDEEEEEGPRFYEAYVSVDGVYEEAGAEAMGSVSNHCYNEGLEVDPGEHQPRIGEVVRASLFVDRHKVLSVRTRVQLRRFGPHRRKPNGEELNLPYLPYEKAFGCLGGH